MSHVPKKLMSQLGPANRVLVVGVKTRSDQYQFRTVSPDHPAQDLLIEVKDFLVHQDPGHRQVDGVPFPIASTRFFPIPAVGIQPPVMGGKVYDPAFLIEEIIQAIPMVNILIQYQNTLKSMFLRGKPGRDSEVVEDTKPPRTIRQGMVSGWPYQ